MMNEIYTTDTTLTFRNHLDHILARLAINRNGHVVEPGLYKLGKPDAESKVFVTANYTLSFDALRSNLKGLDCYILVLDTKGVNVWCAAGKGTFGTEELISKIRETDLTGVVNHRTLILPQLGAPGISGFKIKEETGFKVEYGTVRAEDLPQYLRDGKATAEMRKVRFTLKDRLTVLPVEIVFAFLPITLITIALFFFSGLRTSLAFFTASWAGVILIPVFLPWLPTPNFVSKGYLLGLFLMVPFAFWQILSFSEMALWKTVGWGFIYLVSFPVVTAFSAFNVPGFTTFSSWSGVRREIKNYAPVMACLFIPGLFLLIGLSVLRFISE